MKEKKTFPTVFYTLTAVAIIMFASYFLMALVGCHGDLVVHGEHICS